MRFESLPATNWKVNHVAATVLVALGGAGKTHQLAFHAELVKRLGKPDAFFVQGRAPVTMKRHGMSKLGDLAREHQHIVGAPDELGLAVQPQKGAKGGGGGSGDVKELSWEELLDFLAPGAEGGGYAGANVNRSFFMRTASLRRCRKSGRTNTLLMKILMLPFVF